MTQDEPVARITQSARGAPLVTCGTGRSALTIERVDGVLTVTAGEEMQGSALVEAAKLAAQAGLIKDGEPILLDITGLSGAIDWGAVRTVRGLDIWGSARRRVALLVRESDFATLQKLIATLFPRARPRLFTDRKAALAWLKGASR